jgi:hypothetical protein
MRTDMSSTTSTSCTKFNNNRFAANDLAGSTRTDIGQQVGILLMIARAFGGANMLSVNPLVFALHMLQYRCTIGTRVGCHPFW